MAKDKKTKAAEKKARVAQKSEKKAAQKEKKSKTKPGKDDETDGDDADLDAILAEYAKKQEAFQKVTEIPTSPPPPRSSSTIIANPADSREIFLFGGEHFNGAPSIFLE